MLHTDREAENPNALWFDGRIVAIDHNLAFAPLTRRGSTGAATARNVMPNVHSFRRHVAAEVVRAHGADHALWDGPVHRLQNVPDAAILALAASWPAARVDLGACGGAAAQPPFCLTCSRSFHVLHITMPSTPQWKLRRLAPRAKRVQARRAGEATVIAVYGKTLPGKADAFAAAYDTATGYKTAWQKEMAEGKGALGALLKLMRAWSPLLVRDVPGFDSTEYGDQPTVPDDILEDGERLAAFVEDYKDNSGAPLSYQADLMAILGPALAKAQKEWNEAEAADQQYQKLLADARDGAAVFDQELQSFRRTLATHAGRSDKDFQKLRAEKASQQDDQDDVDPHAPPPSLPVPAAAPGAPPPSRKPPEE
jgi:hypothetical protein